MSVRRLVEPARMKALLRLVAVLIILIGVHAAVPAAAFASFDLGGRYDGGNTGTFTLGAPVRLRLRTYVAAPVEASLYPLALADAVALERRKTGLTAADVRGRPLKTVTDPVHPGAEQGRLHDVTLGTVPAGFYVLVARAGGTAQGRVVDVTTLGAITSSFGSAVRAFAVDLRSLHARPDVTFDRYAEGADGPESRHAGADGLAQFTAAAPPPANGSAGDVLVARGGDGSAVIARAWFNGAAGGAGETGYVQVDRPIYRPGHHVLYRAILRDGAPGSFAVPAGTRTVRLRDPDGKTVYTEKRALDAFGTLSGEIALADDAHLGGYNLTIGDDDYSSIGAQLAVEAYVKPEFTVGVTAPPGVVGGDAARFAVDARYLFGRPAAGMKLHYRAYARPVYSWFRRGLPIVLSGYPRPYQAPLKPVEGDATADAAGRATLSVPTTSVREEESLELEVDARDEAGKTVTAAARTAITPAAFYLTVVPATYFNRVGEDVDLTVSSRGYGASGARPNVAVGITFALVSYGRDGPRRDELPAQTRNVVTDATGTAHVRWHAATPGYVELRAHAVDERGRDVTTAGSIWISSSSYASAYRFDQVRLVPQKASYRPGERASLLVTAPRGDVDALVHVSGDSEDRVVVRHLSSEASTVEIDSPSGVARYRVTIDVPTRGGFGEAEAEIAVVPTPHKLDVSIRPEKTKYAPGERARFAVRVRDAQGNPVRAQLGLAVVDDAIFALRPASAADPFATFYSELGARPRTTASWSNLDDPVNASLFDVTLRRIGNTSSRSVTSLMQPVTTADTYSVAPSFGKLRSDFRDTAYWSPSVVTGADGRALVAFDWPDSLTSYTASGVAVTQGADVGSGSGGALVTKDFLVRLSTPRFLRRGDAARFVALAQGTPSAKRALLRFSAPELGVADDTIAVTFDRNASASARWGVHAGELGTASLRLAGSSGGLRDGLRVPLPVEASGTPLHERAAGSLPGGERVLLRLARNAEAGDLRIDLAPSILAQLVAGVRLLQVYPYYCVEQTMSAALPAIFVDRLRKRGNFPPSDGPPPAEVARKAVERLAQLQHADGSWGWWEHDPANPFMTAYALYGMTELARDGYAVPRDALDRGAASLRAQLAQTGDTLAFWGGAQRGSEWNTRAYMLFALADAKPDAVDRDLLRQAREHAAQLNPYALSVLGLAYVQLGDREGAKPLLAELKRRVADDGSYAHWQGEGWHYRWEDDPIETTAYALRFVHAMDAADPLAGRTVLWLRTQQRGSWFQTTKDTAAAIYAMSEALPAATGELAPHETVRVLFDGRVVKTLRIDAPVLAHAEASVVVPARLMRLGGTLRFEREGTGALYWSTDWTQYSHDVAGRPDDAPFRIERTYSAAGGNDWHVGDLVDVDVTVTADADAQYVAVEDPFPAGLTYQPRQHESGDDWNGVQFFDDRAVFFATRLSARAPLHLHYRLRATTAGSFSAPAPTAYAMYGPPSTATGTPARISIR